MKQINDCIQIESREEADRLMLMCERYKLTLAGTNDKENIAIVDRLHEILDCIYTSW